MVAFIDDIDFVACVRKLSSMYRIGETGPDNEKLGHRLILSYVRQQLDYASDRHDSIPAYTPGLHRMLECGEPPDRLRFIFNPEQEVQSDATR